MRRKSFRIIAVMLIWCLVATSVAPGYAQVSQRLEDAKAEAAAQQADASELQALNPAVMPRSLEGTIDPVSYVLGPGDQLMLVVSARETEIKYLAVLPEGNVILPNVGSLQAAGLTLQVFRAEVKKSLARYYPSIDIELQLFRPRTFVVFVVGQVETPQPVELFAPFRVSHAIASAGGVNERGSRRLIEIREDGETIRTVDLYAFLREGDFENNPPLREGQSVFVPMRQVRVTVVGEVRHARPFEMLPGETAADALDFAGGVNSRGSTDNIMLERTRNGAVLTPIRFALSDADSYPLEDLDQIIVRETFSYSGIEPVRVVGGGGRTGEIFLETPEPLVDFLQRLWRFEEGDYDIEKAVLERAQAPADSLYFEFNVREVLAGGEGGQTLVHPGDVLAFPPSDQMIYVTGNVRLPGANPFLPGMTVEYYISTAGGPTEAGSYDRVDIYGSDGKHRGGNRNTEVYRGDTVVVKQNKTKIFGSLFAGIIGISSLVIAVVALSRTN